MEGNFTLHPVYAEARRSPYGEVHNNCIDRISIKFTQVDQQNGHIVRLDVFDRDKKEIYVFFSDRNVDGSPASVTATYAKNATYYGRKWIKLYRNSFFWNKPVWNKLKIYNGGELCEFVRDAD